MHCPSYIISFDLELAIFFSFKADNKGNAHFPGGKFVSKLIVSLQKLMIRINVITDYNNNLILVLNKQRSNDIRQNDIYRVIAVLNSRFSFSTVSNKCKMRESCDKFDINSSSSLFSSGLAAQVQLNSTFNVFAIAVTCSSLRTISQSFSLVDNKL